jgi:ribonuclease D
VRDLAPFWDVVIDPAIEVVMHAAGEDLRICKIKTGTVPARVFDVQIAAGLAGPGYPLSLGNLTSQRLGVSLAGGETRTDWRRRPLSPAQLRYALDDVRYLLEIAGDLAAELQEKGRMAWAATAPRTTAGGGSRASTCSIGGAWRSRDGSPIGVRRTPAGPTGRSAPS